MSNNVFEDGDPFDDPRWRKTEKDGQGRRRGDRYIGCPVAWLKRVLPLVRSKEQLAIALWLHRRRAVCGSDLFTVPNRELYEELGLTRFAKYRALRHLEQAGAVALAHNGKHTTLAKLLW
jgi:hypothetical protein